MGKKKDGQLGFDVAKAIESLRAAAVAAGAFPPTDPRAKLPHMVADAHVHGVGSVGRCRRNPCRLAGLCLALSEILAHELDIAELKPLLDAAVRADEVSVILSRAQKEAAATFRLLKANVDVLQAREGKESRRVEEALELGRAIVAMRKHAEALAAGLRANAWSKQHHQRTTKKRSDLLLTAVWQHLDWGGLTYGEIFELVPSIGTVTKAKDVVRARVKAPNARSIMPRELHRDLFEPARVEKRRRRRPST